MAKGAGSTPTRVSADVFAAAVAVGAQEHRSATEQVNYWARIGMQVERWGTVSNRRVIEVAGGQAQFKDLTAEERQIAHALIDATIAERAATTRFGPTARAQGSRTVSLDDDGNLIEIAPDGSTRTL
jgi:deoxyxylulose-5-phosphate synthase